MSPKSPRSPRSHKSLTSTKQNHHYLNQCLGCNNVEVLIKFNTERLKNGEERTASTLLHNSFEELEQCAEKCEICRVFRQALLLEEVTFEGVQKIRSTHGQVNVHWQETIGTDGDLGVSLGTRISDMPKITGTVNCNSHDDVSHLALPSDGRSTAVLEQAKAWKDNCLKNHIGQCDSLSYSSDSPQLLIEILSDDFIQLRKNQRGEYVALSYCWGDTKNLPELENKKIDESKTYTWNLDERLEKEFHIGILTATTRDALYIIRRMGVRFAWIDALCTVQDDAASGVATMHQVYSNALFTLCSCATTKTTANLLDPREAWSYRTEPSQLGGKWLTTSDMSLNELRLRSPLAYRAWTLQEERLSPRMLYVSNSRFYWSCSMESKMELKPTYEQKAKRIERPVFAAADQNSGMPPSQEFLLACRSGNGDLHPFWADIVRSYALRSMSKETDRLKALSGLAAKYRSANRFDKYLAGLWSNNLSEGLVWKVERSVEAKYSPEALILPSWSWAALPLQSAIETDVDSRQSEFFSLISYENTKSQEPHLDDGVAVKNGGEIKKVSVAGRTRRLWMLSSRHVDWLSISTRIGKEERFTFAAKPEQDIHAIDPSQGRVLVYEDRKREVIAQFDFLEDVRRAQLKRIEVIALEVGETTMILLEECGDGTHRRVGAGWDVRKDFFARDADHKIIVLR